MKAFLILLALPLIACGQVVKIRQDVNKKKIWTDAEVTLTFTKWGSGIVIGNNKTDSFIITNKHVHDEDTHDGIVIITETKEYPVKIVKTNYLVDLALLKAENVVLPHVKLGKNALKPGEYCEYKGFPEGKNLEYRRGFVKGIDNNIDYVYSGCKTVFIDIQAKGGESGSGVLDKNGNLVGVVCAKSDATCHVVGLPDLEKFIAGEIK